MSTYEEIQSATDLYGMRTGLYLHVLERSLKAFDCADRRRNKVKTKEEFLKYQQAAKKAFMKSMGDIPYDATLPLDAKITGSSVYEGIKIENIIFQSRKDVYATASLYIPESVCKKSPAVLLQCGHTPQGRLGYFYRRGATTLAKSGLIVLLLDPIGQGERRCYPEIIPETDLPTKEHQYFGNQCILAGETPTKYFIADAMRAVDYMLTRPEIDGDKIGVTGVSGGGTMSAVMGVVDDRIKAVAPGIFITTRRDYIYSGQWQDAEQIWFGTTKDHFDHYELIACACPKPYLILGAKSDFFCREGTEKVYEKGKAFYELFGAQDNMRIVWDDATHAYTALMVQAAAEFFNEVFKGVKINAVVLEPLESHELYKATETGQLFSSGYTTLPVCDANRERFLKKKCKNPKAMLLKNIYNYRIPCALNVRHTEKGTIDGMVFEKIFWFSQEHMPCFGVLFKPEDKANEPLPVTVCLWSKGTDAIKEHQKAIRKITAQGRAALIVDLSAMGKCAPYPNANCPSESASAWKLNCDLLFLGDSLCGIRMFELIRAMDMLKEEYSTKEISLYTEGNFATYADILDKIDKGVETERINPVTPQEIITNKLYDNAEMENIAMFGIGVYLK